MKTEKICEQCGRTFLVEYKHRVQRYCGQACSKVAKRKPVNECLVCGKPTTSHREVTCSRACSNKHFRSGENHPSFNGGGQKRHRLICFENHDKRCLVCGYDRVVDVHHMDEDNTNNSPANLIPLCRNHHMEIHTKMWRDEVVSLIRGILGA